MLDFQNTHEHNFFERIKLEEGYSEKAFWDEKQWTYGYGCTAPGENDPHYYDDKPLDVINKSDAETLLRSRIYQSHSEFSRLFKNIDINKPRRYALTNMIFNMGLPTFKGFRNMLKALYETDINWYKVEYEAWDSLWRKRLPNRAEKILKELATGRYA